MLPVTPGPVAPAAPASAVPANAPVGTPSKRPAAPGRPHWTPGLYNTFYLSSLWALRVVEKTKNLRMPEKSQG